MKSPRPLFCFTALLLGLICAGCKDSHSIVGRWQYQKDGKPELKSEIEIRQDGTFGVVLDQMEIDGGVWRMKKNELQMSFLRAHLYITYRLKDGQLIPLNDDGNESIHLRLVKK